MLIDQQSMDVDSEQKADESVRLRGHKLSLTCICIDSKDKHVFTGSKDGSIIKWCFETRKILGKINSISTKELEKNKKLQNKRHTNHINCIAISSDDKFLATGGWDKLIRIWSPDNLMWIHTFKQHRQEITALTFRINHPTLYSGSADRSVMLWTLEDDDNRCFIEALYGHESPVTSIDRGKRERVITSGGRDQSIRIWKIVEQAQTVFATKHESVDIVRYVDDKIFVSGGENGAITVWTTMKRSSIFTLPSAHKPDDNNKIECTNSNQKLNYWITALATFPLKSNSGLKASKPTKKKRKTNGGDATDIAHYDYDLDDEARDNSDGEDGSDEDDVDGQEIVSSNGPIALVASGSCDSYIKVWKLMKKGSNMGLELHQTINCPGFVNDLKFSNDGSKLIAACGQEHRFGRWWKVKGSKNTMQIFSVNK